MKPGHDADKVYLTHMLECIKRIEDYTKSSEDLAVDEGRLVLV